MHTHTHTHTHTHIEAAPRASTTIKGLLFGSWDEVACVGGTGQGESNVVNLNLNPSETRTWATPTKRDGRDWDYVCVGVSLTCSLALSPSLRPGRQLVRSQEVRR